jgi:lysozyme family protein
MDILEQALKFTFGNEGGYSNDPADHGGATNFGIIQRTLDHWNGIHPELNFPADVKNLTMEQAEVIYRADYWRWDGIIDGRIQIKLFDIAVNAGIQRAVKILQQAVNHIKQTKWLAEDGMLGSKTEGEANAISPVILLNGICEQQKAFYYAIVARDDSQRKFLKGWLKRADMKPEVPN